MTNRNAKLLLPILALGLAHLFAHFRYTMDDAYISFRYSSNLAGGLGMVHNPGKYVKGYSNTSWVLLMALPELFGHSPLYFSKLVGCASFVCMALVMLQVGATSFTNVATESAGTVKPPRSSGKRRTKSAGKRSKQAPEQSVTAAGPDWISGRQTTLTQAFCLLVLCVSTPVAVWCVGGLETGFCTAVVLAAVVLRLREQADKTKLPFSAILFGIAILTRPEGIIFFAAMALHDVICRIRSRRLAVVDVAWYLIPALIYVAELGWSKMYFGVALPNTFNAKVLGGRTGIGSLLGLDLPLVRKQWGITGYIATNMYKCGGFGVLFLAPLGLLRRHRCRQNSAFALMVAAQFAFTIRVGGDWMPAARFLVPVMPFLILLLAEAILWFTSRTPRLHAPYVHAALLATVALMFLPGNFAMARYIYQKAPTDADGLLEQGRFYGGLVEPGRSLAAYDIGGIGYASHLEIIDTFGLTDRFIARWRFADLNRCVAYLMMLQPDLIRRHGGLQKPTDEGLFDVATRSGRYIAFDNQRAQVRKGLILVHTTPDDAVAIERDQDGPAPRVTAARFAPVAMPGKRIDGMLYWQRPDDYSGKLASRTVRLIDDHGTSASETANGIGAQISDTGAWQPDYYFADHFALTTPVAPGIYSLAVDPTAGGDRQVLGRIEVIDRQHAPSHAKHLLDRTESPPSSDNEYAHLSNARAAAHLRDLQGRAQYVARAVDFAARRRTDARQRTPLAALFVLNQAKFILCRAYYDLGAAPDELRAEIDAVEAQRTAILHDLFELSPEAINAAVMEALPVS